MSASELRTLQDGHQSLDKSAWLDQFPSNRRPMVQLIYDELEPLIEPSKIAAPHALVC